MSRAPDPASWTHWFGLLTATVLAQANVIAQRRWRRALETHLEALNAAHEDAVAQAAQRERFQCELAQRQAASEQTLRQIFDASLDMISVVDPAADRFLEVNQEYLRAAGLPREVFLNRPVRSLANWADPAQGRAFERELRANKAVPNFEAQIVLAGRAPVEALISAVEVDINGRRCILSFVRDLSARKASEQALQQSEETLRRLFDASLDAMALTEACDGKMIDVNREFLRVTGFSKEEVVGRNSVNLGLWGDDRQRRHFMRQLHESGEVPDAEMDLRVKDGRIVPCLISAVTVKIGARTLVFATTRDISERKTTERRLAENAATLRKLFDASPDVITINRLSDGAYIDVSDSFGRTGFLAQEVAGRSATEIGLWADRTQLGRFMSTLRERGFVRSMEIDIRTKSGAIVPNLVSATIVEINGEPCIASFTRDISRLKRTENELRAAREAALAASRAKSEFLSSVSHEIRTPMNAILGMADLLRETELNSEQRRHLDAIASNGTVLLDLINSILDFARAESGRLSLEAVEFDLVDLVEKVADSLAVAAHEKDLELAVHFVGAVARTVIGDPMRLRQVLTNLTANAVKFTERGEVVLSVGRNPDGSGPGSLRFTLSDTGIGIPEEKLSTIFSPFTQADCSTSRKYGGSGLGLAIVDRLVALMGGQVSVESAPGRGSVFTFTAELTVPDAPPAGVGMKVPQLDGVRVLVVDDTAINRQIVREMLAATGARITECASAAAGLSAIEQAIGNRDPFRLMLIDARMPELDGFQMVEEIQKGTPRTARRS